MSSLIRPTSPTPPDTDDDQGDGAGESTPAAANAEPKTRSSRRRRSTATTEPAKGRKISLPDSVFERLELTAIKKKTTISAVAADLLDRNLPRLRIESD